MPRADEYRALRALTGYAVAWKGAEIIKRVKPGCAPSAMGAAMSVVVAVFGVFWTIAALYIGAPGFFALFGVVFVVMAIVQAVYNYKNAAGKERFSVMDIVDNDEKGDPTDR